MDTLGEPMLSGLQDTGMSLFQHLSADMSPDPEQMDKEREAVQFGKSAVLKDFYVKTFDLKTAKASKEYAKLMLEIFHGIQARTHVILFNERKFVETQDNPRWIAHIEWAVFELKVEAYPTVPGAAAKRGDTDAKSGKESAGS